MIRVALMAVAALGATHAQAQTTAPTLGSPAACELGQDCFVQQFPDMLAGAGDQDPFCGVATYDGHDGTDLRLRSMADVARGVDVVAVADGTVLRTRDGVADRLVQSEADRAAVANLECGNGLVVDLGGGLEAQYCHMKQGSLVVKQGAQVKKGDKLGSVGASGMAQFPHVHLTLRRDGKPIDPSTGAALSAGCAADASARHPLWDPEVAAAMGTGEAQALGLGLAGGPIDHAALTVSGPPPEATAASANLVGWVWFANLRKGDQVWIEVLRDGAPFAESKTEPMDRNKATYSAFAGKRGAPAPGRYDLRASLLRNGAAVLSKSETFEVK
ncbi:M23 family peptidase [Salmonella enterica subsp. enterica]|nr:M23 family peptidase [Salmonella enterica subsp. enterica]